MLDLRTHLDFYLIKMGSDNQTLALTSSPQIAPQETLPGSSRGI